jgi:hypothetical protein
MDEYKAMKAQGFALAKPKNCAHGRLPDRCTECAKQTHIEQLESANALLRKELGVHKERGDRMHELVCYAYQQSSAALMMPPSKPREARAAREQALCDINKKMGGAIR